MDCTTSDFFSTAPFLIQEVSRSKLTELDNLLNPRDKDFDEAIYGIKFKRPTGSLTSSIENFIKIPMDSLSFLSEEMPVKDE